MNLTWLPLGLLDDGSTLWISYVFARTAMAAGRSLYEAKT